MSQCLSSWDIEENQALLPHFPSSKPHSKTNYSLPLHISTLDCDITELTWKDGHLGMHGFGVPKILPNKTKEIKIYSAASAPATKCSWEKPVAGGTLESLVNQATSIPSFSSSVIGTVGSSTLMGSCTVAPTLMEEEEKEGRVARLAHDWNEQSICGSGTTCGKESRQASHDTCEREICNTRFTLSTSFGSPENTSSPMDCTTKTVDDHDSVCDTKNQKRRGEEGEKKRQMGKLSSGKRSRCAAVHNQSERKRRDKINQRMRILQKLVPNSSKTDKASMLDEVIEYLKQLQAKVEMMNRMNMSTMMLPLPLQQQLQMSAMASMGMGMGMNIDTSLGVMDMNTMTRHGMPPQLLYPNPFMSMASWEDLSRSTSSMHSDPLNASFLALQPQPMTMDAYSRIGAMYQQLHALAATPATSHL